MKPAPLKRTLNRLAHLGGIVAANHGTLASLVPPHVRRCNDAAELELPADRAWREALVASELLRENLRSLSDRLSGVDHGIPDIDVHNG